MKLHDFLESLYVSTNLKLHEAYHPYLQAKTRAVQNLINAQRKIYTWVSYPVLMVHYLGVVLKLTKAPLPAMEIAKASNDAKEAKKLALQEEQKNLSLNNEPISDQGIPSA